MQQDFASARAYSQRCLAVSRAAGVDAGKSIAPAHLILSQLGLGDASAACRSLRQDVDWEGKLAHQIAPLTLILIAASMTLIQMGEPVYAAEVLSAAMNLPLGDREFYAQFGPARAALNELETRLTPDALRAAMERGKTPILTRSEGEVLYTLRPEFVARLLAMLDQAERPDSLALTPREREVLNYIARGLSNEEIAAELVISFGTAKRHVHNIFEKLGVHNRTQAAARARELGISSPQIAPPLVQKN
jgi:DNA-binding CsgD family transcriptional regulator